MQNCGIYMIKNKVNGKFYIGSSINLIERYKCHLSQIKCNTHPSNILKRAFDKYGFENFEHIILENVIVDDYDYLLSREQWWLNYYRPFGNNGYNISTIAKGCVPFNHFRAILVYDLEGYFIATFDSILDTAKGLGIHKSNIDSCLNGGNTAIKGYRFLYKESEEYSLKIDKLEKYIPRKNNIKNLYVTTKNIEIINENRVYLVYNVKGELQKTFIDLKECAEVLDLNLNSIRNTMRENEFGKNISEYRTYGNLIFISENKDVLIKNKITTNKKILIKENIQNNSKIEYIKATYCAKDINISKEYLNLIIKKKTIYDNCIYYYESY